MPVQLSWEEGCWLGQGWNGPGVPVDLKATGGPWAVGQAGSADPGSWTKRGWGGSACGGAEGEGEGEEEERKAVASSSLCGSPELRCRGGEATEGDSYFGSGLLVALVTRSQPWRGAGPWELLPTRANGERPPRALHRLHVHFCPFS